MRKVLIEFECLTCGDTHERFTTPDMMHSPCECGGQALKQLSFPRQFKIDGFPSGIDGDEWARKHNNRAKKMRESYGPS